LRWRDTLSADLRTINIAKAEQQNCLSNLSGVTKLQFEAHFWNSHKISYPITLKNNTKFNTVGEKSGVKI